MKVCESSEMLPMKRAYNLDEKVKFYRLTWNTIDRITDRRKSYSQHPFIGQVKDIEVWRARGYRMDHLEEYEPEKKLNISRKKKLDKMHYVK